MKLKHKKDFKRILQLHPITAALMLYMSVWAQERNLPFVVTSTVSTKEEDLRLKRKSLSHLEGRAFDLSLRGWTVDDQTDFFVDFSNRYGHLGAYNRAGEQRLIVIHNGTALHAHVQIDRELLREPTLEDL